MNNYNETERCGVVTYNSVLSVVLPQDECHDVLREERLLDLRDRQQAYEWHVSEGLPSRLAVDSLAALPMNEQLLAERYNGFLWEVNNSFAELFVSVADNPESHQRRQRRHKNNVSGPSTLSPEARKRARKYWMKLKLAIRFITKPRLPDGCQGEMCRLVEEDVEFGRLLLKGHNATALRRCVVPPDNFKLPRAEVAAFLDRGLSLSEEAEVDNYLI